MSQASLNGIYREIPCTFSLQNNSLLNKSPAISTESPGTPSQRLRSSLAAFAACGWKPSSPSSPGEKRKLDSYCSPTLKRIFYHSFEIIGLFYFISLAGYLFRTEKRLDDFVTNPISPSEKRTKVEVDLSSQEEKQQAVKKWEDNLIFTHIKKNESSRSSVEEITVVEDESVCGRVECVETLIEDDIKESESELTEVNEVQVVEVSNEEIKVIETLEELESALEDVLALPSNCPVVSKVKTTVPFDLNLLVERNRAQRDLPKEVAEKRFLARINPGDAAAAEAELSRQISQSDFEKVHMVFIVAKENIA